jgi:hypothetical protein
MNQIEVKTTYVDNPNALEVFADSVRIVSVSDGVMRIELCTTRLDEPHPPELQTAKVTTAIRVALTLPAAGNLHGVLTHHLSELEKQGMVKRMTAPTPTAPH